MRYLLCTIIALGLAACGRSDTAARDTRTGIDTGTAAPAQESAPLAERLEGKWAAQGYDAGSNRGQPFTITWARQPDKTLGGTISFPKGETYKVRVVSATDSTIGYISEPHRSPTLKAEVVTRSEARLMGDSLAGTYEARADKSDKVLRGRFTAKRASTAP